MTKRAAAVEETRRRIVEATMALHDEQGILDTSWEDIAQRADVAPATVYRHFPTLDELLPACGAVTAKALAIPDQEAAATVFAGIRDRRARVERMVEQLFGVYERGAPALAEVRRVGDRLPAVAEFHRFSESRFDAIVAGALEPLDVPDEDARIVRALVDFETWRALAARGLHGAKAVAAGSDVVVAFLARRR